MILVGYEIRFIYISPLKYFLTKINWYVKYVGEYSRMKIFSSVYFGIRNHYFWHKVFIWYQNEVNQIGLEKKLNSYISY